MGPKLQMVSEMCRLRHTQTAATGGSQKAADIFDERLIQKFAVKKEFLYFHH